MKVLIAEDEAEIAKDIAHSLIEAGFTAEICSSGQEAWFLAGTENFDALILDLGLPHLDGLSVLRRLRSESSIIPIIVLTARGTWTERVEGINAGADDYLVKPFQMAELIARLRGVLRRAQGRPSAQLSAGSLILDTAQMRVISDGRPLNLTPLEYRLLSYLIHHIGRVVSREELMDHVYSHDHHRDENAIEALMTRLRRKLGHDCIETRRGYGYTLNVNA
jgi:two-component system, OmpR family, response regulator